MKTLLREIPFVLISIGIVIFIIMMLLRLVDHFGETLDAHRESRTTVIGSQLDVPEGYEIVGFGYYNNQHVCLETATGLYFECSIETLRDEDYGSN
ncbi:MAG: hypothetical protein AAF846_22270 [Chloroflexota bacterium]